MAQLNVREGGKLVLLGGGVVALTPFINGFMDGIALLQTSIPIAKISVGTAIAAGIAAFAVQWALNKYMK